MKRSVLFSVFFFCFTSITSAQWFQQQSGVPTTLDGVWFTSPSNGWAVGQNAVILRTTNGGTSWLQVTSPSSQNLYKVSFVDSSNGWITCENNTIMSTTDGGNLWQVGGDGSPYHGTNYGIFSAKLHGNIVNWISGGWMSSGVGVIQKSVGNGSWNPEIIGFAGRVVGIFFINDSLGWGAGDNGLILSTTNGGIWWNQQTNPLSFGLNDVRFFDKQVGLAVGGGKTILKSTDGGTHWAVKLSKPSDPGGVLFRISIVNDSVAFVVGDTTERNGGVILKSTDRGETWTSQAVKVPSGTWFQDICFVNDSVGWAVGSNGVILHTTNGGMGSVLATPALSAPISGDTLEARDTAFVWYSVKGAASYELRIAMDTAFSSVVLDSFGVKDTTLALKGIVGTRFTGKTKYYWHVKALSDTAVSQFSITWRFITPTLSLIKSNKDEIPKTYELNQNYPNPFNPTTVINYGLPKNSFVTLTIYDELGRRVETLVSEEQNAGYHSISFDASRLSSGVYFYRIEAGSIGQAGSYTQTKKLVLLK